MRHALIIVLILVTASANLTAQSVPWSLQDCIERALASNSAIRKQQLKEEYSRNLYTMAKLKLLPEIGGSAAWNMSFGRALDETTYNFIENERIISGQSYASGSLTLLNGFRNYNNILKNKYELIASGYDLEMIKENIIVSVTLAYLQILLSKELLAVIDEQLQATRLQIVKTAGLVSAGSLPQGALLETEAQEAREELQRVTMQNQLDMSLLSLRQLLELDDSDDFDVASPSDLSSSTLVSPETEYETIIRARPAIKAEETRLRIADIDLRIARGGQSPVLNLSTIFSTGYSDARRKLLGTDPPQYSYYSPAEQLYDNINYGIGLRLSIPLLNGWKVRTSIKNSEIELREQGLILDETRKQLLYNLMQASADVTASLKKYEAAVKAAEATDESFRNIKQRYDIGMVTSVEYNTAKTNLLRAKSEVLQAKYEYMFRCRVLSLYQGNPEIL